MMMIIIIPGQCLWCCHHAEAALREFTLVHAMSAAWHDDSTHVGYLTNLNGLAIGTKKAVLSQRWPRDARYINRSWSVAEIWPFEIIQDGGGRHLRRHLEFVLIDNRSAVPENPILEQNMKWIGSPVAEIWSFAYVAGIWNPHFGGRGGCRGSATATLERAMVVSYRLSIVTVALSVTIRPQFAIECLRRSNQQELGDFDFAPKFKGVPLGADPSCWGCKERTSQAN